MTYVIGPLLNTILLTTDYSDSLVQVTELIDN